jgi:hypothetical protein
MRNLFTILAGVGMFITMLFAAMWVFSISSIDHATVAKALDWKVVNQPMINNTRSPTINNYTPSRKENHKKQTSFAQYSE